jgi:hypothetical protein
MFFCARTQAQRKNTTHFDFIILHDGHSLFMMPNISGTCPEVQEQSTYDVQGQLAEFQRVGADVITEYAHSKLSQQRGSPHTTSLDINNEIHQLKTVLQQFRRVEVVLDEKHPPGHRVPKRPDNCFGQKLSEH